MNYITKARIYDELSNILTAYENKDVDDPSNSINWEREMYDMLVTIQNNWENVITTR